MKSKEEILKIFKENNIKDIDKEIINIIYLLNFELNLKTVYSCYGHEKGLFYLQFEQNIDDKLIYDFIYYLNDNLFYDENNKGVCDFWIQKSYRRFDNEMHNNWIFRASGYCPKDDFKNYNKKFVEKFEKCLLEYIKSKGK